MSLETNHAEVLKGLSPLEQLCCDHGTILVLVLCLRDVLHKHHGLFLSIKVPFCKHNRSATSLYEFHLLSLEVNRVLAVDYLLELIEGTFYEDLVLVGTVLVHYLHVYHLVVFDHFHIYELLVSQLLLVTVDRKHPLILGAEPVTEGLPELQLCFLLLI